MYFHNVWLEHCKRYMFPKCKSNDFTKAFVWRLFLIKSSQLGVNLAECIDSCYRMSFWFLPDLIFIEDRLLISNKPHGHPRLPKPNLKFLLNYWTIISKQLSQARSCSNQGLQIASYTEMSNVFYRIKYDGQKCQVLT